MLLREEDSSFLHHEACPNCGSSDALARYSDGHGFCHSCGHWQAPEGSQEHMPQEQSKASSKGKAPLVDDIQFKTLKSRHISESTCSKFGYGIFKDKGNTYQVACYRTAKGTIAAQKLRDRNKEFSIRGDLKKALPLWGQHLWPDSGRRVVVTEGEIDALSVAQMQDCKWPVVSLPNGAQGGKKAMASAIEWLEGYEEVVLCFDQDEPGQSAAVTCAELLTPGKAKIVSMPLKDANEMLCAGRGAELLDALWKAKTYRPDGIVTPRDVINDITEPERGLSYPWEPLTELTYGIRLSELVGIGAGTGTGKSELLKELAHHLAFEHGQKVGLLFLEESCQHTVQCLMSKHAKKRLHIPDADYTQEEYDAAKEAICDSGSFFLYDHFGANDWKTVKSRIKYMVHAYGCKYIILDHITMLVSGDREADERKELDYLMTDMAALCRQLNINIHFVSHLTTPEGTPHEEGGRVYLRHFRGSRSIGQLSSFAFGLERNQQEPGSPTTVRCLKDRYTGQAVGKTFLLRYDPDTGLLNETTECFEDKEQQETFKEQKEENNDF